jgi:large subunit ribosomal protein L4
MLSSLGVNDKSVLMVTAEKSEPVWKSVNNLAEVKLLLSGYINVRDLLSHDTVVLTQDAVNYIETWLGADIALVDDTDLVDGGAETESVAEAGA